MKIAFCITCKGRLPHLKITLAKNIQDNPNPNAIFVLLSYNSTDGLDEFIKENFQNELNSGKLVYYQNKDAIQFKMAHAKNMVHRLGINEGADILVNLDADNFTGEDFANYIEDFFERTKKDPQEIFLWSRMLHGKMARGISGRIVVAKNAFLVSGGYNEKYENHSPDDKDFNLRLRRLGYCAQEIDSKFLLAVNHTDKLRFREYPEAENIQYEICQVSRVVNNGNVGCGIVFRNFNSNSIILKIIPTRIFGIGIHKTATTSLYNAFKILGFKAGHWENAHWAKAVWNEVNNLGKSISLERFYTICDIPISQLYKQLDLVYPNSKFVLTIREESDWIESIKNHFDSKINPFQKTWDQDPFTHKIHLYIYGRKKFDKEIFLSAYRKHNAEVIEYFKDRPNDLLIMNMNKKNEWKELCNFLDVKIPLEDYPVKNKSIENILIIKEKYEDYYK